MPTIIWIMYFVITLLTAIQIYISTFIINDIKPVKPTRIVAFIIAMFIISGIYYFLFRLFTYLISLVE
jgi:hypothetical protein